LFLFREGSEELDRGILEKLEQLREETNCERRYCTLQCNFFPQKFYRRGLIRWCRRGSKFYKGRAIISF